MAKEICTEAGGFLAEIQSPEEDRILRQSVDENVNEFWIGGSINESSWIWNRNGKSIQLGFSDIAYPTGGVMGKEINAQWFSDK